MGDGWKPLFLLVLKDIMTSSDGRSLASHINTMAIRLRCLQGLQHYLNDYTYIYMVLFAQFLTQLAATIFHDFFDAKQKSSESVFLVD